MRESIITPGELADLWASQKEIRLIDVRTPVEYREAHVPFARNIPLDLLDPEAFIKTQNGQPRQILYLICRSGDRAAKAAQALAEQGYPEVVNIEGGTEAWERAGLPLTRGRKAVSLERQVRIAAGLLVLLGIGLSVLVHPYFIAVAAFVAGGLVFAGVTDTCAMGLMLAKMPWNQVREKEDEACFSDDCYPLTKGE